MLKYKIIIILFIILTSMLVGSFFIFNYVFKETNVLVKTNSEPPKFELNAVAESFKQNITFDKQILESSTSTPSKEKVYDYEDYLLLQNKQKEMQAKMKLLVINTNVKSTIEETCNFEIESERINCKKDLFIGCADSLYLGLEMADECEQFPMNDYLNFIEIKKNQEDLKIKTSEILQTEIGEIHIVENEYTSKSDPDLKNAINSGTINTDKKVKDEKEIIEERKILEPEKAENVSIINWNRGAYSNFYGWVTGWGTLFAINGGRREAGQIMNKHTAFGYNPYLSSTCIVSLPYKTVDKFFGTSLDYCVKTKNTACIIKIKNQIQNRAIEVLMLKNGKRAVFPLGDFGPAEWTGNAIDFTSCARNILGATGKDLIKFRPLP